MPKPITLVFQSHNFILALPDIAGALALFAFHLITTE